MRKHFSISRKPVAVLSAALLLAFMGGCTAKGPTNSPGSVRPGPVESARFRSAQVCGRPILDSPYNYHGAPGKYASGAPGLPTYGTPHSDFPKAVAGVILPPGKHNFFSYELAPRTVYYLLPGVHVGFFQVDAHDAIVGGFAKGVKTTLSGDYSGLNTAIDSNYSNGNQPDVTIEYLTIEKYQANVNGAAINQSSNTGWALLNNTIALNVPGAGVIAGANSILRDNCLTLNGQYGFQSSAVGSWGQDSLTKGPYNITVEHNEISYNDTCDFEGLLSNKVIGWSNRNPVPVKFQNPHCGKVTGDGNQGGFKLWGTDGVTIKNNYIHNNWGPGIWADTNNANTTYVGNVIADNDGEAIIEEISYNFSIRGNYIARNGWAVGLNNPEFPNPAIYISESGSSTEFGGVPACREASCSHQAAYPRQSEISGNTLVDNGGGIFLWQNSDRHCSSGFDRACTLVDGAGAGPFTLSACHANLPSASINTATYVGNRTGSPPQNWWDGCLWKTENVSVTHNVIDFNPASIDYCNRTAWPDCGANGIFSEYSIAPPYTSPGAWIILSQLTFFQHNTWSRNVYNGPSTFYAWNQGNRDNPVSWARWTGDVALSDKCSSDADHESGACSGPFGQDSGSTYRAEPLA